MNVCGTRGPDRMQAIGSGDMRPINTCAARVKPIPIRLCACALVCASTQRWRLTGNHKLSPILNNKIDDQARSRTSFILKFTYTKRTLLGPARRIRYTQCIQMIDTYTCSLKILCIICRCESGAQRAENTNAKLAGASPRYYSTIKMFTVCARAPFSRCQPVCTRMHRIYMKLECVGLAYLCIVRAAS